jgi:hypothetical protein
LKKHLAKLLVIVALAVVICLPGDASAEYAYVQTWYENGLYGTQPTLQTWNIVEAVLLDTNFTWTGTGLSGLAAGWTATLLTPQIALAYGPTYDVGQSGNFFFTTSAASSTDSAVSVDWLLWNGTTFVGGQLLTLTSTGGYPGSELTQSPVPPPAVPIPPSLLLLGSALMGLVLLGKKKPRAS